MTSRGKRWRKVIAGVAIFVGLCLIAWFCLPPPPPLGGVSYSQRVFDRQGRLLRITLTTDEKYRLHASLEEMAPEFVAATLLQEDRHFWHHPGINPFATARATMHFAVGNSGRGGASTITMQLARLRYGLRTRTARGKLVQMFRALQLDRHYSKRQILEAYLNLAPYGRNIEGVGAASVLYFGKPAANLSRHEAIALSVIPQRPTHRAPRADAEDASLAAARARLDARFGGDTLATGDFQTRAEAVRPFAAPHAVNRVLSALPTESAITTTLDHDLQRLVERRMAGFIKAQRRFGVRNAAAMLIDFTTMEVLAQAGSADFFDESIDGQVDGTRSRRSPGSTLKPFIYALAIDQGLIQPRSIVKDAPRRFGGYEPENFDGGFSGPITATEALARSRNLPAVELTAQLAHPRFYEFLKRTGVALPREEGFYGLALPLGGGEVTMEELVRLYAVLANGGRLRSLQRTLPHGVESGARVLSPEACFLTLEMLGQVPRPGLNSLAAEDGVAWKTGTSHGFRDAWSVAVFDRYVLAVWVGNFDGRANPTFVGRTCAGPLLFQIIDAMRSAGRTRPRSFEPLPGANLRRVELCAVSGQLPGANCPHCVNGWFVPGVSPIAPCEVHREVLVDTASGLRVSFDDGSRAIRHEVFEFWSSDLMTLFEKAGLPRRRPPPFLPGCEGSQGVEATARFGKAPQITSPQNGRHYAIDGGALALTALTETDATRLYWFAGREFLGATSPAEPLLWKPIPGNHRLVALDDQGRSSICTVTLESSSTYAAAR